MQKGSTVVVEPTQTASRQFVSALENIGKEVRGILSETGRLCTIILDEGVTIPGYSHPHNEKQHYLDIPCEHLKEVA